MPSNTTSTGHIPNVRRLRRRVRVDTPGMPITQSAKKSLRKDERRRIRNLQKKEKIKDLFKEVRSLIAQNKTEEARKLLPRVYKIIDKAVKTGLMKKNTGARQKSKISKLIGKPRH